MSGNSRLRSLLVITWFLVYCCLPSCVDAAERPARPTFVEAPWKVILFVCSPSANGLDAMTLYGDGRLVVYTDESESKHEEYEIRLEKSAIFDLLQIVSDHGLHEYDGDEMRETQLGKGMESPPTSGNAETTVLLSLLAHEIKGDGSQRLEKIIRMNTIDEAASSFPDLTEVQGVFRLRHQMSSFLARARAAHAPPPTKPDYSAIAFEFSRDSTKVILLVRSQVSLTRKSTSMFVYGDGRVEMRVEVGSALRENYNFQLTEGERLSLLRSLVTSGLADYDSTSIRARQLIRARGEHWSGPEDAANVTISFDIGAYGDEDHTMVAHSKTITMPAPDVAAIAFPGIPEIVGVTELQNRMFAFLDHARRQKGGGH